MTTQEVKLSNFYESTLATGGGGLPTNVTTTTLTAAPTTDGTSAIGANYYLVIDPDSASKREVVEVTAATGTTLTSITRDKEGRYGTPGDAATAPNHAEGTVVRMAVIKEMFEDVHDRIEDIALTGDVTGTLASATQDIATTIAAGAVDFAMIADTIDEDNMASDSATKLPTQQSVKAYADTQDALKLSLTGGTLSGNVAFGDNEASAVLLKDYAETDVAVTSAATLALDLSSGNTGSVTLDTNVTTLTFTNVPTNGVSSFTLKVVQDGTGSRTMALSGTVNGSSATFKTPGAAGLTLSTGAADIDLVTFLFFDGDETNVLVNSLLDFS